MIGRGATVPKIPAPGDQFTVQFEFCAFAVKLDPGDAMRACRRYEMRPRHALQQDCGATGLAHTRLRGSDWIEIAGWLLGGPARLALLARGATRSARKICARCGSDRVATRGARPAARAPPDAAPSFGARSSARSGAPLWRAPLTSRAHACAAVSVWLAAWTLAAAGLPGTGTLLARRSFAREIARDAQLRFAPRDVARGCARPAAVHRARLTSSSVPR